MSTSTEKAFDCIAVKDEVQAKLAGKWRGMTDEEIRAATRRELETSGDDLARWWRRVCRTDSKPFSK